MKGKTRKNGRRTEARLRSTVRRCREELERGWKGKRRETKTEQGLKGKTRRKGRRTEARIKSNGRTWKKVTGRRMGG